MRLATEHDVDLILLDAAADLLESGHPDQDLGAVLERAPCDVGVLSGAGEMATGPVVTPFGGVEHDWSRDRGGRLARPIARDDAPAPRNRGESRSRAPRRQPAPCPRLDCWCSRLSESSTEPVLVRAGEAGVLEASRDARLLVVGLSDRWRTDGIGRTRLAVALGAEVPTLFVRRGLRPGGVAPNETLTRFTWTLGSERIIQPDA